MANTSVYEPIFISKGAEISPNIQQLFNQSIVITSYRQMPRNIIHKFINKKNFIQIIKDVLYRGKTDNISNNSMIKINSLLPDKQHNNNYDIDLINYRYEESLLELCKSLKILPNEFTQKSDGKKWAQISDDVRHQLDEKWTQISDDVRNQLDEKSDFKYTPGKLIPQLSYPKFLKLSDDNNVIINKYNTILLSAFTDNKIIGYLQYSVDDDSTYTINIEYVEVHPEFRGRKLCNKLIELLIHNNQDSTKYTLYNVGRLAGYRCYVSAFRKNGFNSTLDSGRNIKNLNNRAQNNLNKIKKGTKTNNNNNKFYLNTINFEKLV